MHYPPPNYNQAIVKSWYYNLKDVTFPACQKLAPSGDNSIDLHHIDPTTKKDCVSSMVHKGAPLNMIIDEVFKVIPICRSHHVDYHKHERWLEYTKNRYDFIGDDHYKQAENGFWAKAWLTAPNMIKNAYTLF